MFVFGKGLMDAVDLEAKKAIFPRIIIDNAVINDLSNKEIPKIPYVDRITNNLNNISGVFNISNPDELLSRTVRQAATQYLRMEKRIDKAYHRDNTVV
jgi:hypothetical protein